MTATEHAELLEAVVFFDHLDELHRHLKKMIKDHTKLKQVYRHTPHRDKEVGQAYEASKRRIRGVHWACWQSNKILQKGVLHMDNEDFDRAYMLRLIKSLPLEAKLKKALVRDFTED